MAVGAGRVVVAGEVLAEELAVAGLALCLGVVVVASPKSFEAFAFVFV